MEKNSKVSFFKGISRGLSSLFSEDKKIEKETYKKLQEQKDEVTRQVQDLIDVNALATVYELTKEGYKLTSYQNTIFDEKIEKLYLKSDSAEDEKIQYLTEVGYKPKNSFIINKLMDMYDPKFILRNKIYGKSLFKEILDDSENVKHFANLLIGMTANSLESLRQMKKSDDYSSAYMKIRSEIGLENIINFCLKEHLDLFKPHLTAENIINILKDVQLYKIEIKNKFWNKEIDEIEKLVELVSNKVDKEFNSEIIDLIANTEFPPAPENVEVNESINKEIETNIKTNLKLVTMNIKPVIEHKEGFLKESKEKIEKLEERLIKTKFEGIAGLESLEVILNELKTYKLTIQIEKVRKLSAIENYSNTLRNI